MAPLGILLFAPAALAQGPTDKTYTEARRLGTSTSFNGTPLIDAASIKRMAERRGIADDIRKLLADSGLAETSDAVLATLSRPNSSVKGGRCTDMTPQDGVIVECEFQPGANIEWMAHRPKASKGDRTPDRLVRLRWAGKPFQAFLFRVTTNDKVYTFMLPKPCGNLSLVSEAALPKPAPAVPPPAVSPLPPPAAAATPVPPPTVEPPPTVVPPPAAVLPPVAPPVATPIVVPPPVPTTTPTRPDDLATMTVAPLAPSARIQGDGRSIGFFVDALVGKDRRVRPVAGRTTVDGSSVVPNAGNGDFSQCSPLFGVKFGVAKRWDNDWELAGAVGVALSLVTQDDKVREHQILADVEINKYAGKRNILLGTGLSLWDLTHSDTFTPAWMVHVGVPLGTERAYLMGEGRLFLKDLDNIENNYQVWAGLRIRF